jgi:HPr Serine kinase C-terminal domain
LPLLHASAWGMDDVGVLVVGASGAGKSALVAEAVSRGGFLIADDQVVVEHDRKTDQWLASAPAVLHGVLHLRGLGIIRSQAVRSPHPLHVVARLGNQPAADFAVMTPPQAGDVPLLPQVHVPSLSDLSSAAVIAYLLACARGEVLDEEWLPML